MIRNHINQPRRLPQEPKWLPQKPKWLPHETRWPTNDPNDLEYTDLVEGHNEGCVAFFEQVDGLNSLWLESVHNVHHQDSNVTQRGASTPQVTGIWSFIKSVVNLHYF